MAPAKDDTQIREALHLFFSRDVHAHLLYRSSRREFTQVSALERMVLKSVPSLCLRYLTAAPLKSVHVLTSCSRHPVKLFLFFLPFLPPLVFEKAEIMPPFVLALQCHEQACQFPSFGGCCLASRWNWTRVKTWHVTSPYPLISESDCVNQVGSNPSSQALHGMRVVEMARFILPPW